MSRRALCWSVALAVSFAAAPLSAQAADHPVVSDSTDGLSYGANVRAMVPSLSKEWIAATVGSTTEGCTVLMVPDASSPSGILGVTVGSAKVLQVEFRDTDGAVKWKPVAIKTAAARDKSACDASMGS